jgi:hypothetical protein
MNGGSRSALRDAQDRPENRPTHLQRFIERKTAAKRRWYLRN